MGERGEKSFPSEISASFQRGTKCALVKFIRAKNPSAAINRYIYLVIRIIILYRVYHNS
jgi:hypothetical protein